MKIHCIMFETPFREFALCIVLLIKVLSSLSHTFCKIVCVCVGGGEGGQNNKRISFLIFFCTKVTLYPVVEFTHISRE